MVGGRAGRSGTWAVLACLLVTSLGAVPGTAYDGPPIVWLVGFADVLPRQTFLGADIVSAHPLSGFVVVASTDPRFPTHASLHPAVRYVELDGNMQASAESRPAMTAQTTDNETDGTAEPDDPLWPDQYGAKRVGAPDAWNTTRGDPQVHLCLVDSGLARTHEDIPTDRIVAMRDLVQHDDDPQDGTGHGTHVASIAAANTDNGRGIAGLADLSLLVVRVLDDMNRATWSRVAAGIEWCTLNGGPRTVINLSLGGSGASEAVKDAVNLAHERGHLIVAAAGNRACDDCVDFPARIPQVIAVGCTDDMDTRCADSAGGGTLDIMAPGALVIGADPQLGDTGYSEQTGTSLSTPHVAAAAGLVWSHHPDLRALGVAQRLLATAADLGPAGLDPTHGHGLLDIPCALLCTLPPPAAPDAPVVTSASSPGTLRIDWDPPVDPWSDHITRYHVYRSEGAEAPVRVATTAGTTDWVDPTPGLVGDHRYSVQAEHAGGPGAVSAETCRPLSWTPYGHADTAPGCAFA